MLLSPRKFLENTTGEVIQLKKSTIWAIVAAVLVVALLAFLVPMIARDEKRSSQKRAERHVLIEGPLVDASYRQGNYSQYSAWQLRFRTGTDVVQAQYCPPGAFVFGRVYTVYADGFGTKHAEGPK